MKNNILKRQLLLASSVLLGSGMLLHPVTVMAASAEPVAGTSGEQSDVADAQTVTVSGLKSGSSVKLYQIVDGYYKDGKLVRYVLMDPTNGKIAAIGDSTKGQDSSTNDVITESEITTIANNIQSGVFTADAGVDMTIDPNDATKATAAVEPGMYLALATDPSGETVYNPAVVSVNITDVNNNTEEAGSVDMTQFFTSREGDPAAVRNAYLKSTSSGADKKITGSTKAKVQAEGEMTGENAVKSTDNGSYQAADADAGTIAYAKGDVIAKGDTVHFRIDDMTIPSFSADYTKPQYMITDTPDASFDKYTNLKVTVGGTEVDASDTTYTVEDNGTNGFKITFAESYLENLRGASASERAVVVTYDAVLSNPTYNYAENHNRATIQFSNNPTDESKYETINKDTYHYTFAIDSSIDSEDKSSKTTYEYNKVTGKHTKYTEENVSDAPLAGAVFTLYSDEDCETAVTTATSDADGHITIEGLDEGTYYLKETTAPDGYTLADQTYRFVIAATLDDAGVMTEYSITSSYKDAAHSDWTSAAAARYTSTKTVADDGSVTNSIIRTDDPISIVDTKTQKLPSTGGTGTIILTICAAAGMALFLTIHVKNKRREEAER